MAALPIMVLLSCSFAGLAQSVNIQSARLSPEGRLKSGELVLRKRHVEEESIICAEDEYNHPDSQHCCKKCYSGFRKVADCPAKDKITECEPCPKGHFLEKPNSSRRCRLCFQCIPSLGQITKSNCTQSKNTECGCASGQFKVTEGESFRCQNCSQCENGKVIHQCFNFTDTLCSCNFGFFFDKAVRQCLACETCADAECRDHCPPTDTVKSEPPRNAIVLSVLPSVGMLVVLVILGVYIIRKRRSTTSTQKLITFAGLSEQETSPVEFTETTEIQIGKIIHPHVETNLQLATPSLTQITMPLLQQPDITLDARAQQFQNPAELYNVIDNIPLNRWREFVRRLGLSDNEIDGCEYQNTRRFRDAQYDMLMIWSQNVGPLGATKEAVIGVLKEMSLMGPVEAILDGQ